MVGIINNIIKGHIFFNKEQNNFRNYLAGQDITLKYATFFLVISAASFDHNKWLYIYVMMKIWQKIIITEIVNLYRGVFLGKRDGLWPKNMQIFILVVISQTVTCMSQVLDFAVFFLVNASYKFKTSKSEFSLLASL